MIARVYPTTLEVLEAMQRHLNEIVRLREVTRGVPLSEGNCVHHAALYWCTLSCYLHDRDKMLDKYRRRA